MVDFGYFLPERPFWKLVTQKLRPGDMPTHCFLRPSAVGRRKRQALSLFE